MKPMYLHTVFWLLFSVCIAQALSGCHVSVGTGSTASGTVKLTWTLDNKSDAPSALQPFYAGYGETTASEAAADLTPSATNFVLANAFGTQTSEGGSTTGSVSGIMLSGIYTGAITGSSTGLQMVYWAKLSGLSPSTNYWLNVTKLGFMTSLPANCTTGEGAEQVSLIAGASATALSDEADSGFEISSPDLTSTSNAMILGNAAISAQTCTSLGYMTGSVASNQNSFEVTSDTSGDAYVYFGAISKYTGTTTLYFTSFDATLTPVTTSSS